MKRILKKSVDERQEKELRTIESFVYHIMLWGLAISIYVQALLFKAPLSQVAGELIILTIGAVAASAGYIKKGVWGYFSNPTWKSYLANGIVLALAATVVFGLMIPAEKRILFIAVGAVIAFFTGFSLTALLGYVTKKNQKELESEYDQDK